MATIEISDEARDRLDELVAETGDSEQEVVEQALEALEEKLYAEQFQKDFADMHARGDAWSDEGDW